MQQTNTNQEVQDLKNALRLSLHKIRDLKSSLEAVVIPIRLDVGVMQRQFEEEVPALYRGLVRSALRRASASSGDSNALRARLASLASEGERLAALVELVQEDIAAVLALPGASSVPADAQMKELGMDSLMVIEFRNRMQRELEVPLGAMVAFDYPTLEQLSGYLLQELRLGPHSAPPWRPARSGDQVDQDVGRGYC